ncbi:hypothetical protein V2J09_017215 [Rumex salicifolius]
MPNTPNHKISLIRQRELRLRLAYIIPQIGGAIAILIISFEIEVSYHFANYSNSLLLDDVGDSLSCTDEASHRPDSKRSRVESSVRAVLNQNFQIAERVIPLLKAVALV